MLHRLDMFDIRLKRFLTVRENKGQQAKCVSTAEDAVSSHSETHRFQPVLPVNDIFFDRNLTLRVA